MCGKFSRLDFSRFIFFAYDFTTCICLMLLENQFETLLILITESYIPY